MSGYVIQAKNTASELSKTPNDKIPAAPACATAEPAAIATGPMHG